MRAAIKLVSAIIIASFIIGIWLYPSMPDMMPGHWNAAGRVDGYMPKFWGLFLMPIISVLLFLLFVAIPRIDPLKENIEKFRKHYDIFISIIIIFLFYLYALTLVWASGVTFNMVLAMVPAFALIFYYAGILVENAKQNWFIGIRTPWTLSSKSVWNKTHKRGGRLFKAAAIIALLGLAFGEYAIWFVVVPVVAVAVYSIVYSYVEYRKEKH
jgi:uncharacterized membrane protein